MSYFIDLVVVGLSLGMVYSLVALGISLIYSGWSYGNDSMRIHEMSINSPVGIPIWQIKMMIPLALFMPLPPPEGARAARAAGTGRRGRS